MDKSQWDNLLVVFVNLGCQCSNNLELHGEEEAKYIHPIGVSPKKGASELNIGTDVIFYMAHCDVVP